ncbi:MAG TPA: hypothetical protein VMU00_00645 [Steroidobacteraceae bacterium]|nr:hypothetical protein [Steroidobacteraceae bacterium]
MSRSPLFALLLAAAALAAAARAAPAANAPAAPDPRFKVPRTELLATVRSVGVMTVTVPDRVPDAEAVARRLEQAILAHLAPAGFELVPPQAMREIQDRAKTTLGGLYDPMTGHADNDKIRAYREYIVSEYRHQHPVDAWLRVAVVERAAPYVNGKAAWDGVSDSCTGRTGLGGLLSSGGASGYVPALTLVVRLDAADGRVLYQGVGGLQVLRYVKQGDAMMETVGIDPKFIMSDPARDERALGIALDPLARGAQPPEAREPAVAPAAPAETAVAGRPSRDELLARYHRVALAPLEIGAIEQHDAAQARYAQLVTDRLTKLGFEVVPAEDWAQRWRDEQHGVGGLYDPYTGHADPAKFRAARARVAAAVRDAHEAAAVVVVAVEARSAYYHDDYATWDGIRELAATSKSGFGAIFSPTHYGYVKALSLSVRFVGTDGDFLYEGRGGIQLTEHLDGQRHVPVPEADLFRDQGNDELAVQTALQGLAPPAPKRPASH